MSGSSFEVAVSCKIIVSVIQWCSKRGTREQIKKEEVKQLEIHKDIKENKTPPPCNSSDLQRRTSADMLCSLIIDGNLKGCFLFL